MSDDKSRVVTLPQIVAAARKATGVTIDDLRSRDVHHPLVKIRHAVVILAIRHTGRGIAEVGRYLQRDHTTILHVIGGLKRRITNNDPMTHEYVKLIEERLFEAHWPLAGTIDPLRPSPIPMRPGETKDDLLKLLPASHKKRVRQIPFIPMPERPCISWRAS